MRTGASGFMGWALGLAVLTLAGCPGMGLFGGRGKEDKVTATPATNFSTTTSQRVPSDKRKP